MECAMDFLLTLFHLTSSYYGSPPDHTLVRKETKVDDQARTYKYVYVRASMEKESVMDLGFQVGAQNQSETVETGSCRYP